jgi:hypothetical protein
MKFFRIAMAEGKGFVTRGDLSFGEITPTCPPGSFKELLKGCNLIPWSQGKFLVFSLSGEQVVREPAFPSSSEEK